MSTSRAQPGHGDVAGLPGGTLVARGHHRWAHTSPTTEPDQNKGRVPARVAMASSSGSAERTMALSLLGLRASSSLLCRAAPCAGTLGRSQPQVVRCRARERGHLLPGQEGKDRGHGEETHGDGVGAHHSGLRLACPRGSHRLERCECFALGSSIQQGLDRMADPTPLRRPTCP